MDSKRSKKNFTAKFHREKMSFLFKNSAFLCVLFGLFSFYPLAAQDVNYRVDIRYIQRLTWVGDEYAMRYEVIIERLENRRYSGFFRGFTEDEFIEVSMPPGNYRYQVIPYDYLNSPVNVNEWTEFEVLRAPANIERSAAFEDEEQVTTKLFDIYFGAAYLPLLPVYNANIFSGADISLISAGLKFAMVLNNRGFIYPGAELTASWRMFDEAHLITVELNFLGQIRFPGKSRSEAASRTAFNFRAGFGVSLLAEAQSDLMPKMNIFHVNLGVSFLALVMRNFYIETGIDLPQFISSEHYGYFRPWISIGARF